MVNISILILITRLFMRKKVRFGNFNLLDLFDPVTLSLKLRKISTKYKVSMCRKILLYIILGI